MKIGSCFSSSFYSDQNSLLNLNHVDELSTSFVIADSENEELNHIAAQLKANPLQFEELPMEDLLDEGTFMDFLSPQQVVLKSEQVVVEIQSNQTNFEQVIETTSKEETNLKRKKDKINNFWTDELNEKLRKAVEKYGQHQWVKVASMLENKKNASACRERWVNYEDPQIDQSEWKPEEDRFLSVYVNWHSTNKISEKLPWVKMSEKLQVAFKTKTYRPPNALKNRWNGHLKPRFNILPSQKI